MKQTFIIWITMIFSGISFPFFTMAQQMDAYQKKTCISGSDTMPYRILYPVHFNPLIKYPLVVVLHGSGERGNDNEAQLNHGGSLFLKPAIRKKYPCIVVFPQCPKESYWSNVQIKTDSGKRSFYFLTDGPPTQAMTSLMGLLGQLLEKPYINKHRVYIGGLSMGGMGTYEALRRMPDAFAAAFVICGGDNPANAAVYARKVPIWIFHGAKDDIVSAEFAKTMAAAIKASGGNPKLTIYPDDNHNSWDDAFAEPMLIPWLFSHKK